MAKTSRPSLRVPATAALLSASIASLIGVSIAASVASPALAQRTSSVIEILPRKSAAARAASDAAGSAGWMQFADGALWLDIASALAVGAAAAIAIAWHPRSARASGAESIDAGRRGVVIAAFAGVASGLLVSAEPFAALLLVGIAIALRGHLAAPSGARARSALVFIAALAAGLGQLLPAAVLAAAGWLALWWIDARRVVRVKIRVPIGADVHKARLIAGDSLARMRCRVRRAKVGPSGRAFSFIASVPVELDDAMLATSLAATLAPEVARAKIEIRAV